MSLRIAQSFTASYDALTGGAAVFDRSVTDARLEVTGPDRTEWLQGLLTNDVAALAEGEGCYAAYLTPQGRMIGDLRVLHRGDRFLLDVPAAAREAMLSRLDQFIIMEDVTLSDVSASLGCASVAGPAAAERLAARLGVEAGVLAALEEHAQCSIEVAGQPGFVAASRELGVPGFDVYLPPAAVRTLIDALLADGAVELDEAAALTARIEAGRPRFGVDIDSDTIPLEAGIESRAISFTKGCYVGQEIIIRVLHRGQGRVARRVCRLVSTAAPSSPESEVPWKPGAEVSLNGRVVGRVTSASLSPRRERVVAFAVIGRDAMAPGTRVAVDAPSPWDAADVEALQPETPAS